MPSLWNAADLAAIKSRIENLLPQSPRKWGTLTVDQMMRHLAIAYDSGAGIITLPREKGIMGLMPYLKPAVWLMIHVIPWPKGLPTSKSFLVPDKAGFDAAKQQLTDALAHFIEAGTKGSFGEHPLFGKLSHEDWGILLYKHTDHHLRQFGV